MNPQPNSFRTLMRHTPAFLPVAMSLTALCLVLGSLALYGVPHDADEGTVAHLWQFLMAGQLPVVLFFAIKWLPRATNAALGVLAAQAATGLASLAPVFFLHL